jgi:hypothetical protein
MIRGYAPVVETFTAEMQSATPMDAIYLDYASGALSEPARLLVDTQFALRPELRAHTDFWETVGAVLLQGGGEPEAQATPAGVQPSPVVAAPATVSLSDVPGPLGQVLGRRTDELPWREPVAGTLEYVMPRWPQARLTLFKEGSPAGWSLGPELALVLDGALSAGGQVHRAGDMLLLDRNEDRPAPETGETCLCFCVQESGYSVEQVRDVYARPGGVDEWTWRRV